MEIIRVRESIVTLVGRCSWGVPEELCTVDELTLRQQYTALSTQYYTLLGLIPKQTDPTKS